MAAIDLFDAPSGDDSDADDLSTIKINEEYARRLEHNKRREALHRLEDLKKRGLVDDSDSDDEEESSEDEDDNVDLAKLGKNDVKFLETLVRVKKQDPSVLQQDAKIYSSDEDSGENEQKPKAAKKDRPLYLKDVNARHLIEEGPELGEKSLKYDSKVYNKDQADAIKAFLAAEKEAFAAAADDDEDILKEKGNAVEEKEDIDAHLVDQNLNEYFGNDDELSENEKFLKEYLRNKMWIDKDAEKKPASTDILEVSDDDEELEKQERYEAVYNFRHEQGEGDRVLGHSRIVEGSVRKKTTSRKAQRKSKEERMLQAELERKEELKHLKNLKKKEIQEKLQKIRTIAGIGEDGDINLDEDDLEEDFDPEEYDKKMKKVFGNNYYEAEDADPGFASGDEMDLEKPDFDKEDELLGLPKGWDVGVPNEGFKAAREKFLTLREKEGEEEEKKEDDEEEKHEAPVEGKRKRKRKISLKEKVALDKELEEYYKLDYEDTIGDLKTRFKYRSVPANTYGLRTEEILTASEKDLNQYVSLKRLAPYREKEWEVTYHQRKKKDLILHGEKSEGKSDRKKHKPMEHPSTSEREGKQSDMKKHKPKEHLSASETEGKQLTETEQSNAEEKKLSRRERRKQRRAEIKVPLSRLEAYGIVPPKTAKKR